LIKNIYKFTVFITFLSFSSSCTILAPVDRAKYDDLEGRIFSVETNQPIANAKIEILESSSTDTTDEDGKFLIRAIPTEWLTAEVSVNGYEKLTRRVKIEAYGTKYIDFWLTQDSSKIKSDDIIFERDGDIWETDEYGFKQANITERMKKVNAYYGVPSTFSYKYPVWYLNKSKIAYIFLENSINPNTLNGLWTMSSNGKTNQRITYIDSRASSISISKDGNDFLYSMINPDNASNTSLYRYNKIKNTTENFSGIISKESKPDWSPDGKHIAYSSGLTNNALVDSSDTNTFQASRNQIFTMDKFGFNRKQLTQSGENNSPVWSPDGERIAFVSNRSGYQEIWLMSKDGSGQRRLTLMESTRTNNPVWSKDGKRILFNTNYKQKYNSLESSEAWIFELSTQNMRMLSNDANTPNW